MILAPGGLQRRLHDNIRLAKNKQVETVLSASLPNLVLKGT